jgi:hypothetical protein
MRMFLRGVWLLAWLCSGLCLQAAPPRILKVLPHYLDKEGRAALSPSLYERDAYQALLRADPEKRSALRIDVNWKAPRGGRAPLLLRVELRSSGKDLIQPLVLERPVRPGYFSRWSSLRLTEEEYASFGQLMAWRVTLWQDTEMVAEQKSFLW